MSSETESVKSKQSSANKPTKNKSHAKKNKSKKNDTNKENLLKTNISKDEKIPSESEEENLPTLKEENLLNSRTDFEALKREMSDLYGSRAVEVHELETSLQMSFDNYSDMFKAAPWPIIPFKRK